jgi:peptidoglycan/LPS O-acetylase OafA/YrhL
VPKTTETVESPGRYRYIDALRGYAILGVIALHTYLFAKPVFSSQLVTLFFTNASEGVELFYLVSTFAIFSSHLFRVGREQNPTLNFFVRRFFRIAPMYFFAVIFFNLILGRNAIPLLPLHDHPIPLWRIVFFTFGFFPDSLNYVFPGSWSIAVETSFYLLFPLIFLTIRNIWSALLFLAGSVWVAYFSRIHYTAYFFPNTEKGLAGDFSYRWIGNQLPVFALGTILFFALKGVKPGRNTRLGYIFVTIGLGVFALCLVTPGGYYGFRPDSSIILRFIDPYMPDCLGLALLFTGAFLLNDKIVANELMLFLGRISFSFYILNLFVIGKLYSLLPKPVNFWILISASLLIGSLLSWCTYRLIELPGIMIGKKLVMLNESRTKRLQENLSTVRVN